MPTKGTTLAALCVLPLTMLEGDEYEQRIALRMQDVLPLRRE